MQRMNWFSMIFLRYYRHLGLRVSTYALLSVIIALASPLLGDVLAKEDAPRMTFDSVTPVLTILATTMLAVSTFALNNMVSAYRAAAAATSPRAHRILLEGTTTQSVLATFIGAFVYSLTSIVLYRSGFYTEDAAVIVMGVTIFVVVLVILAMLRWVQHLSTLGSVDHSLRAVSSRAADALAELARAPCLGGQEITAETVIPTDCLPLKAARSGYIQLVDMRALSDCLAESGAIYVLQRPGAHVLKGETIARVSAVHQSERLAALSDCFTIEDQRTFEQDAAYGLEVLSEIACKALSPGINDSGTAIATIHRLSGILSEYASERQSADEPLFPSVFVIPFDHKAVLDRICAALARDAGATLEVAIALRQMLSDLHASGQDVLAEAARQAAQHALHLAEHGNMQANDLETLRKIKF